MAEEEPGTHLTDLVSCTSCLEVMAKISVIGPTLQIYKRI